MGDRNAMREMATEAANSRPNTRRLVVNADDFGWSRSVNHGILEAHVNGIVTSASILAAGTDFDHAVGLWRETPSLELGVHLNVYRGMPLLAPELVPSLVGADGRFLGSWKLIVRRLALGQCNMCEVEAEFRAAIERVLAAGIAPTHLNSEKHLHLWPSMFSVVARLAEEYSIPFVRIVRESAGIKPIPFGLRALSAIDEGIARSHGIRTSDATIGVAAAPVTVEALAELLQPPRGIDVELVVHPGYVDEEFIDIQSTLPNLLVRSREQELAVLTSREALHLVEASGYRLDGFRGPRQAVGRVAPERP